MHTALAFLSYYDLTVTLGSLHSHNDRGSGQDLKMTAVQSTTHCLPVPGSSASGSVWTWSRFTQKRGGGWAAGITGPQLLSPFSDGDLRHRTVFKNLSKATQLMNWGLKQSNLVKSPWLFVTKPHY